VPNATNAAPGRPRTPNSGVLHARLDLLFDQAPPAVATAVVLGLLTLALLWRVADPPTLTAWLCGIVGVSSARLALAHAYRSKHGIAARPWLYAYLLGTVLAGMSWGMLGLLVDFAWPAVHQVGAFTVLAGVCAGAISNNGSHLAAYLAFLVPCLGPLVARLVFSGDPSLALLGAAATLYGAGLTGIALPYSRALEKAQVLAAEKDGLLGRVSAFNDELQAEVAQRRRAEIELLRERRLFVEGPVTVFRWANDNAWTICAASPNVRNLGLDAERLVREGVSYKSIIHADDRVQVASSEFRQTRPGDPSFVEQDYRIVLPDGRVRWVYDYTVPVTDAGGVVTHLDGYILDITDRKRAEADLIREKERALVTLQSIGDGILRTDASGRVEYLNPIAERLTGWPVDEARGRPLREVCQLCAEAGGPPLDPLAAVPTEAAAGSDHHILCHRAGEEFAVTVTIARLSAGKPSAGGSVLVLHDVTEARSLARRLAYQASHDPLTGLVNRREFEQRLAHSIEDARTTGVAHVCLYLDLDQFKVVNDTCGHPAGDELLRQIAAVLQPNLRASDALARLGGDEFGVLLEGCPLEQGREIAEALRRALRAFRFAWADRTFDVGASVGVVRVTAASGSVGAVLSAADVACYAAKDLGRNRVHVYEESDLDLARRRGEMQYVSRITEALAADRLVLHAQAIVPIADGAAAAPRAIEVLVRMREEDGSLVPPSAFLPAAERYNLMPALDRWVARQCFTWLAACADPASWQVGINLSGTTLSDDHFLEDVNALFAEYAVPPQSVCFEITETAAIASLATATRVVRELRALGCRFALDDFGTGLSSFNYLKNLPVDFLKIDGSFVRDLLDDPLDRAMVRAINDVGHAMGIGTIAEFVERPETLQVLRVIGVDYAQGWATGRPRPLADFMEAGGVGRAAG
jgi:diguanylate cyclase (GGDEF)-like protein/PAS domain S-box-containing protein